VNALEAAFDFWCGAILAFPALIDFLTIAEFEVLRQIRFPVLLFGVRDHIPVRRAPNRIFGTLAVVGCISVLLQEDNTDPATARMANANINFLISTCFLNPCSVCDAGIMVNE
jgi:hypothetical protein